MTKTQFSLALNALLPHCDPKAPQKWAEFAARCVNHEMFVYFIPTEYNTAVEKWLDSFYAGLYAVKQEHGMEIATRMAGLPCQQCDLFPGEMMSAADVLKDGGTAAKLREMYAAGTLKLTEPHFFDLPDGAALSGQGLEIAIFRSGVPCGLVQKRIEPGYLLADGTALLESERDSFGRWRGGAGMDGMYLQTGRLYAPVRYMDGEVRAFREVQPVMARERETAYLTGPRDAFAIYRLKDTSPTNPEEYVPLDQLQKSGGSPLDGNYNLVHVVQTVPGGNQNATLNACRDLNTVRPGDIMVFKEAGAVQCWYVDQLAFSALPGLLENRLKSVEMSVEQNANQIDGIINNEAPKPSLRDNLKQCQDEAGHVQSGDAPAKPQQGQER